MTPIHPGGRRGQPTRPAFLSRLRQLWLLPTATPAKRDTLLFAATAARVIAVGKDRSILLAATVMTQGAVLKMTCGRGPLFPAP